MSDHNDVMEIPSLIRRVLYSSAYGCLRVEDRKALTEYILDALRMRNNGFKHLARAEAAEAEVERLKGVLNDLQNSDDPHVRNSVLNFLEDRSAPTAPEVK